MGLTIAEVSRRSTVDPAWISNAEAGRKSLPLRPAVLLGRVLGLSIEQMVEVGTDGPREVTS